MEDPRDPPRGVRPRWVLGPGEALAAVLGLVCDHVEEADGFREEMIPVGDSALQLLEATGPGTVATFLERRGPGLHHIALRVDDVTAIAPADLCARGIDMIDRVPRAGGSARASLSRTREPLAECSSSSSRTARDGPVRSTRVALELHERGPFRVEGGARTSMIA